jgi:hypothetical protein
VPCQLVHRRRWSLPLVTLRHSKDRVDAGLLGKTPMPSLARATGCPVPLA